MTLHFNHNEKILLVSIGYSDHGVPLNELLSSVICLEGKDWTLKMEIKPEYVTGQFSWMNYGTTTTSAGTWVTSTQVASTYVYSANSDGTGGDWVTYKINADGSMTLK